MVFVDPMPGKVASFALERIAIGSIMISLLFLMSVEKNWFFMLRLWKFGADFRYLLTSVGV